MYEYAAGKVDWMANGLPVEGEAGPFVAGSLVDVPTCRPDEAPADVARRIDDGQEGPAVVLNDEGIVVGTVSRDALKAAEPGARMLDLLEPSPDTIRASVPLSELDESAAGVLVTTPFGVLLGAVDPEAARRAGADAFEAELHEVMEAVQERFGDREPDEDELRTLLRERLIDHGRTPEEADRVLAEMAERDEADGDG